MRVVIVDCRQNRPYEDGTNLDVPEEGREALMSAIEHADVLVEISQDGMWVKEGVEHGVVTLVTVKSEAQMSMDKALREKAARTKPNDDLEKGTHPVNEKFAHVWDGSVESGKPVEGGLKGY